MVRAQHCSQGGVPWSWGKCFHSSVAPQAVLAGSPPVVDSHLLASLGENLLSSLPISSLWRPLCPPPADGERWGGSDCGIVAYTATKICVGQGASEGRKSSWPFRSAGSVLLLGWAWPLAAAAGAAAAAAAIAAAAVAAHRPPLANLLASQLRCCLCGRCGRSSKQPLPLIALAFLAASCRVAPPARSNP